MEVTDLCTKRKHHSHFLTRYYTCLQLHPPSSPLLPVCLGLYSSLQIATLLIPADSESQAPWNYTVFWPVWKGLNAVARPDELLVMLALPGETVLLCLIVVFAVRVVTTASCFLYLGLLNKHQFRSLSTCKSENYWGRRLLLVDKVSLYAFTWAMWRPILVFCTRSLACTGSSCLQSSWAILLAALLLPCCLLLITLDRMGTCDLQWQLHGVSLSSAKHRFLITLLDLLTAVLLSFLSFAHSQAYLLLFAALLGLLKFLYVYRKLPYHQHMLNLEAAFQGLLLVLQSALLWIAVFFDQSGLMPSLSLFFIVPFSVIFIDIKLKRKAKEWVFGRIQSDWQREFLLRQQMMGKTSLNEANPKSIGLWSQAKLQPLMWSAYYYLKHEDFFAMKVLLARICALKPDWLSYIPFSVCIERLTQRLESDPEERVLRSFLALSLSRAKVIAYDYLSTRALKSFYEKLLHRHVSFQDLVQTARYLSRKMKLTLDMYEKILAVFKEKKSLLQAYCSLLETLGSLREAAKCHSLIAKVASAPQKQRIIEGVEFLQTDDSRSVLLLVQCQGPEAGTIKWAENAACLGYTEESLVGCDMGVLIPELFRDKHKQMFGKFAENWHFSRVFNTSGKIYFVSRENLVIFGEWKLILTNSSRDEQLAILSVFRQRKSPMQFAFFCPTEQRILERTRLFAQFLLETDFLLQANFSLAKVWAGTWRNKAVFVRRDEWVLFQAFRFPILVLCLRKTGRIVGTESDLSLASFGSLWQSPNPNLKESFAKKVESMLALSMQKSGSVVTHSISSSKGVYKQVIRRHNRPYLRLLGMTLAALFAISATLNLVTVSSIVSQNYQLNQDISEMQALRIRTNSITSSLRSKELFLLNHNYSAFTNETKSRTDLAGIGTQLGVMAGYLMGNASKQTGRFRSLLLDPVLPYWVHEVDSFSLHYVSLVNMMLEMASRANALAATPLANITTSNSDFMTLYRNGVVEAMHAFNLSVAVFAEQRNQQRAQMDANMNAIIVVSVIIQLAITVGVTVPLLVLAEKWRRLLWALIMKIPKQLLAEMLKKIHIRLESLHEDEDFEGPIDEKALTPLKDDHYAMSPEMKRLILALALYAGFLILSVYLVYYIGVTENADILLSKPKYIHWAGLRRASPWMTVFYMRESYLPFNLSYSAIIGNAQWAFSSPLHWVKSLEEINYVHHCLTYGCPENGLGTIFLSTEARNLLLGTPCVNCSTSIRYGLTPLISELIIAQKAAYTAFLAGPSTYSLGKTAEKAVSTMAPFLADAVTQYDAETLKMLGSAEDSSATASAVLIVIGFLALILVLLPLISKVGNTQNAKLLRRELQVLKNIQNLEDSETLVTLAQVSA